MERLKNTVQAGEYVYDIFVLDPKGTIIASSNQEEIGTDKSNEPFFYKGKKVSLLKMYIIFLKIVK